MGKEKTIEELIEASSLGTPEAKALRAQTPPEVVAEVLRRVKAQDAFCEPCDGPCRMPEETSGA